MKGWLIPLYFLLFSLFFSSNSCALPLPSCPHGQSAALTQFNNSFSVDCSLLPMQVHMTKKTISWKEGTNCCLWDGVKCDTETGNVIALDLSFSCLVGPLHSNSTLFLLPHLRNLNLAGNHFNMSPIASQFGQLTSLIHLNISESGFRGKIPLAISQLSKLLSLDLSENHDLIFEGHVFENVVKNLTQLRHLHLSYINMSSVAPTSFINMSSFITTLILEENGLQGKFPEDVFHFPYLQKFNLFEIDNQLELKFPKTNWSGPLKSLLVSAYLQELPDSIGNLRSLEILELLNGNFKGPIPASLGNLTQLEHLYLSSNNFAGPIPYSIFNLTQVQFLDLSGNKLVGSLPSKVSGLSQLSILRLDHNFLSGRVPSWLFSLPSLVELMLNSNKLNGTFELDKLSEISKLEQLSLSDNALSSFTSASNANYSLPNLVSLELSSCNISEFPNFVRNLEVHVIEADMFLKLKGLEVLDLSHNIPLFVRNNSEVDLVLPLFVELSLSSCNITELSNFLTTQESLNFLDLSNNNIQGQVTEQENNWGSNLVDLDLSKNLLTALEYYPWKSIEILDLGSNLLEGPLVTPPPSTMVFLISNNRLNGEIPSSICDPARSDYLLILDLSYNNLSGAISKCLGLRHLAGLNLQGNSFHGNVLDFCVERNSVLESLNLNKNDFDGSLPKSLANCSGLEVLNLGNKKINDTYPYWLGDLPGLKVLVLRSNYFHGQIAHSANKSHFSNLQILDLSHNMFSGFLPTTYFTNFKGMMNLANVDMAYMGGPSQYYTDSIVLTMKGEEIVLERILTIFAAIDMSSNRFEGTIPETVGNLISLIVLNFSHNHLTGHIPSSLGNLAALESLDLSCNRLVGEIPSQLTGLNFLEVLNLSDNHLVGLIPQGKQFNTFLNDSYVGNTGLCGFPVSKSCGRSDPPPAIYDEREVDSAFGLNGKFVMMGYGCGLVFGFSAGYIMMTIRKPKWLVGMIQRAGNRVLRRFKKNR
ncbi:hypothetical protein ES332_A01G062800v1 [Gossypium tomentosum]|uniref:Leucine-rich repeat-containing N-terminal plant-type domain-containing protein n=1 Tax=Gossypium tomentosum TaxID=34277 RepID=A0A5D2RN80_GOSTO|nr:hypothetical protein ES332_A01G062800v1 [Gossypium tomentosum]